jgi:hypothetical protein
MLDNELICENTLLRSYERYLRNYLFHDTLGDDWVYEPWLSLAATRKRPERGLWGEERQVIKGFHDNQAFITKPNIYCIDDIYKKLKVVPHEIDEGKTNEIRFPSRCF